MSGFFFHNAPTGLLPNVEATLEFAMTVSLPDPPDQRDVSPTLSGLQAQIQALRSDLTVFSDDRRGIVAQIASLVVDVSRLTEAVSEHCRRP